MSYHSSFGEHRSTRERIENRLHIFKFLFSNFYLSDRTKRGRIHDHISVGLPQRLQHGLQHCRIDKLRDRQVGRVRQTVHQMLLQKRHGPDLDGLLRQTAPTRKVFILLDTVGIQMSNFQITAPFG